MEMGIYQNQPTLQSLPTKARQSDSLLSSAQKQQDKMQLTMALAQVCELQKQYGKTAANLETLVEGFMWLLDGTPMDKVLDAMKTYMLSHNDIPTPSDLLKIINPPEEPLSKAVFIALCQAKERGEYLTPTERKYMRDYENQEITKTGKKHE